MKRAQNQNLCPSGAETDMEVVHAVSRNQLLPGKRGDSGAGGETGARKGRRRR